MPGMLGAMLASKHVHPHCVPQTLCSAASRIRATEGGSVGWCPRPRQPCVWDRCVCLVWRGDRGQGAPLPHLLHQPGFFPGLEIGMAVPLGHTERLFGGFVFISLGSVGWKDGLAWQLPPGRTVGWPRESMCALKEIKWDRKEVRLRVGRGGLLPLPPLSR